MFDPTQLPTEPCDPAELEKHKQPVEPAPQFARAPVGDGHEAAIKQRSGQR